MGNEWKISICKDSWFHGGRQLLFGKHLQVVNIAYACLFVCFIIIINLIVVINFLGNYYRWVGECLCVCLKAGQDLKVEKCLRVCRGYKKYWFNSQNHIRFLGGRIVGPLFFFFLGLGLGLGDGCIWQEVLQKMLFFL